MNEIKHLAKSVTIVDAYALTYNGNEWAFLVKREDHEMPEYVIKDEFGNEVSEYLAEHLIEFGKSELEKKGLLLKRWTSEDIEELKKELDTSN